MNTDHSGTELLEKIQAAAADHLPSATAGALKKRLEEADVERAGLRRANEQLIEKNKQIERLAQDLKDAADNLDAAAQRLRDVEAREVAVAEKEANLLEREIELRVKEGLIGLREVHASQRCDEMREVVRDVFSNNKFKYERTLKDFIAVPGSNGKVAITDQYGNTVQYAEPGREPQINQVDKHETVKGEGAPPAG